jgi:hypothetical protein
MLKQVINGKTVAVLNVTGSEADITALKSILEGEIHIFESKFTGGTAVALPENLNAKRVSVGKKYSNGVSKSASFRIPHVNPAKTFEDIRTAVIGNFDETWDSSTACEYSNLIYDRKEA